MRRRQDRGGGTRSRSHRGRRGLALQEILVDVLGVPLQPGCVQQDVLAALLDGALRRGSGVALKEGLYEKHTTTRKGAEGQRHAAKFPGFYRNAVENDGPGLTTAPATGSHLHQALGNSQGAH